MVVGEILDLESWLQLNGLRSADYVLVQEVSADELESRRDLEEQQKHIQSVHKRLFAQQEASEREKIKERERILEKLADEEISITTKDGVLSGVPAIQIAKFCDTVLTLYHWEKSVTQKEEISLDLSSFPSSSVLSFVFCALESKYEMIKDEALIDCCFIAHYLCANTIVEDITSILVDSINTSNCYYFCQIANQLDLSKLFEHSLAHMMGTIGDLESNPAWDDLTFELRDRIKAIKGAIQSSMHSGNRLYFGTMEEYIAIFAERVQYYRERLEEAKEQLEQNRKTASHQALQDVEAKIQRQEARFRTLQMALAEQKKLFLSRPSTMGSMSSGSNAGR